MQTNIQHRSPYVGPRPFERRHTELFYGRDREASELLDFVSSNQIVLVYAQSGVGKTSLLNAGLIPLLEKEEFEIFPIARVRGLIPEHIPYENVNNPYVLNTLISWVAEDTDPSTLLDVSINQFLHERPHQQDPGGFELPRVAIFDQFEELFSFYPDRWQQREDFFKQLRDALNQDDLFRVIFVMREDFIAQVDPYADILPGKLRSRFRLEPMTPQAALAAATIPLKNTSRSFAPGAAEKLIEELTKVRVETQEGETRTISGEFVEPVQLQVVCQNLWQHLPADVQIIDQRQIEAFGDIDQALSKFYEDSLSMAVKEAGVDEQTLRQWFDEVLITPAGTRGTVYQGKDETGDIPNDAVMVLENQHIIRAELRAGGRWYELTHDRFIEPIQKANAEWGSVREDEQQKSRERVLRQRFQRQVLLSAVLGLFLIAAVGLTVFALQQRSFAEEQAAIAETQAAIATVAQGEALIQANNAGTQAAVATIAQGEALIQANNAETQVALAAIAQNEALNQAATATSALAEEEIARARAESNAAISMTEQGVAQEALATAARVAAEANSVVMASGAQEALTTNNDGLSVALALQANAIDNPPFQSQLALVNAASYANLVQRFDGHTDWIQSVVFSPDGRQVLSASSDTTFILWDVETGQPIHRFEGHTEPVRDVAFSPDGRFVVSGGDDNQVILWDIEDGKEIHRFEGHTSWIYSVAFSPDGHQILSGSGDNRAILWDIATGNVLQELDHSDNVQSVVFHPDGQRAATGSDDNNAYIWDLESGEILHRLSSHLGDVNAVTFSPNGQWLLTSSADTDIILWNAETGTSIRTFEGHTSDVNEVIFNPDGHTFISASRDITLRLWDLQSGSTINIIAGHTSNIVTVAFNPQGNKVVSGALNTEIFLWDITIANPLSSQSGEIIRQFKGHTSTVNNVSFSPDGRTLLSASSDRSLILWDIVSGAILRRFIGHNDFAYGAVFSPDGQTALSASSDETVIWWDIATGNPLSIQGAALRYLEHSDSVFEVAFSPDGQKALSGGFTSDGVREWDLATGTRLNQLNAHRNTITAIEYLQDGQRAITASRDQNIYLWDMTQQEIIQEFVGHQDGIYDIAISPDEQTLLSASFDDTLLLWDIATGRVIQRFVGHNGDVYAVDFSPDGRYALSGADDNTLILWDIASGLPLRRLLGHTSAVYDVEFSPDGTTAISASADNTLILWRIAPYPATLVEWVQNNRYAAPLNDCRLREFYRVEPLCKDNEVASLPTFTPFPTLAPTATFTPSPTLTPSVTYTPSLTATATPTATATVTQTPSSTPPVDLNTVQNTIEQLVDAELIPADQGYLAYTQSGSITIDLTDENNVLRWENLPDTRSYADFIVSVDIVHIEGEPIDGCGLRFRAENNDNYYFVGVRRDSGFTNESTGSIEFRERDDGTNEQVQAYLQPRIMQEHDDINTLVIVAQDSEFKFFVNGFNPSGYIPTYEDTSHQAGVISPAMLTFNSSDVTSCVFSNLWIWNLGEAHATVVPTRTLTPSPTPTATPTIAYPVQTVAAMENHLTGNNVSVYEFADRREVTVSAGSGRWSWNWNWANSRYTNFVLGATIQWDENSEDYACGFNFRIIGDESNRRYYMAQINREGGMWFNAYDATKTTERLENNIIGDGSAINTALDSSNELVLVAVNDTFTVYVNGHYAGQFSDDRFVRGRVGLMTRNFNADEESTCIFTDVWTQDLTEIMPTLTPTSAATATPTPDS